MNDTNGTDDTPYRKLLLALVSVAPLVIALALAWRFREHPDVALAMVAAGTLFSFGVARTAWLGAYWARRTWRRFAEQSGFDFEVGFDGEPRIVGEKDGVFFRISVASPTISGAGHYTRTYATAGLRGDVPRGMRVYLRSSTAWVSDYSGLRGIETGDAELDTLFFIEGEEGGGVADFVTHPGRRAAIVRMSKSWPNMLVYGKDDDGLPIAADEEAAGAITMIEGGRRSARRLAALVGELCGYARALQ